MNGIFSCNKRKLQRSACGLIPTYSSSLECKQARQLITVCNHELFLSHFNGGCNLSKSLKNEFVKPSKARRCGPGYELPEQQLNVML